MGPIKIRFHVEKVSFGIVLTWFENVQVEIYLSQVHILRSRPKLNYGAGTVAAISGLGPNSEPRGNNQSFPETCERACVPAKKIGSRDSIFGLVNSTYFFNITNHNQHASKIKYLANLIKKYWTQCCRKCKILARLTDHLWLMVGWSV